MLKEFEMEFLRRKYNYIRKEIVKRCWELSGCICTERLYPMLAIYIEEERKRNDRNS